MTQKLGKKELLLQLLELENGSVGDLGKSEDLSISLDKSATFCTSEKSVTEDAVEVPLTKPKKILSEKQKEALKRGQDKRNENRELRAAEMKRKKEEEQKILEEKLIKKAIAVKKKQIKRAALLEEISDDETPPKVPLQKPPETPPVAPKAGSLSDCLVAAKPQPRIIFY